MWQEARKQEKKIRGMLVDFRKRAERRQSFYEQKIKGDPTQFLQCCGRKIKIHLDPAVAQQAENPNIMLSWMGHKENMIDRFDVRAHLDYIPVTHKNKQNEEEEEVEGQINYEAFRVLAQNEFLGVSEEKYLHQLYLEEQFGVNAHVESDKSSKKKNSQAGAAIGYTYDENEAVPTFSKTIQSIEANNIARFDDVTKDDSDCSDVEDVDVSIDINKIGTAQAHELNTCGRNFGMKSNDFYSFLTRDADEAETMKLAKEEEAEKILLVGRKSRRERRAQREKRFLGRTFSPPSYAAKAENNVTESLKEMEGESRTPSPENADKIVYITSFGGEEEAPKLSPLKTLKTNKLAENSLGNAINSLVASSQMSYADKVKQNLEKLKKLNEVENLKKNDRGRDRRRFSRERNRSRSFSSPQRWARSNDNRNYSRRSRSRSNSVRRRRPRSRSPRRRDSRRYSRSSSSSSFSSSSQSSRSRSRHSKRSSSSSSNSTKSEKSEKSRKSVKVALPPALPKEKSKSKSPEKIVTPVVIPSIPVVEPMQVDQEPSPIEQPVIKRYYGRKREGDSSDENSDALEEQKSANSDSSPHESVKPKASASSRFGTADTKNGSQSSAVASTSNSANLRDRLKRKMQNLLNKQYKADKKLENERQDRQLQLQQEREEEMRELALKLRKRQREMRHKYGSPDSQKSEEMSSGESKKEEKVVARPRSRQRSRPRSSQRTRTPSRSRSRSRGQRARPQRSRSRSKRSVSRRSRSRSRGGNYNRYRNSNRRNSSSDSSRSRNRRSRSRSRERPRIDRDRTDRRDFNRGNNFKSKKLVDY